MNKYLTYSLVDLKDSIKYISWCSWTHCFWKSLMSVSLLIVKHIISFGVQCWTTLDWKRMKWSKQVWPLSYSTRTKVTRNFKRYSLGFFYLKLDALTISFYNTRHFSNMPVTSKFSYGNLYFLSILDKIYFKNPLMLVSFWYLVSLGAIHTLKKNQKKQNLQIENIPETIYCIFKLKLKPDVLHSNNNSNSTVILFILFCRLSKNRVTDGKDSVFSSIVWIIRWLKPALYYYYVTLWIMGQIVLLSMLDKYVLAIISFSQSLIQIVITTNWCNTVGFKFVLNQKLCFY